MVIMVHSTSNEQFEQSFVRAISADANHSQTVLGYSLRGRFEGSIDGNSFTLVKTAGLSSNFPQRRFYGVLSYEGRKLVVKGRFRFSKVFYVIHAGLVLTVFLFLLFSSSGILSLKDYIKGVLYSLVIPMVSFSFCYVNSRFYEEEVIKLIKTM